MWPIFLPDIYGPGQLLKAKNQVPQSAYATLSSWTTTQIVRKDDSLTIED